MRHAEGNLHTHPFAGRLFKMKFAGGAIESWIGKSGQVESVFTSAGKNRIVLLIQCRWPRHHPLKKCGNSVTASVQNIDLENYDTSVE